MSPGEGYRSNRYCLLQGDLILEGPWKQGTAAHQGVKRL